MRELVTLAREGMEVVLVEDSQPVARIVPVVPVVRVRGMHAGEIEMGEGFDDPSPQDWTGTSGK